MPALDGIWERLPLAPETNQLAHALLAEGLMQAGALADRDWTGSLEASLRAAFARIVKAAGVRPGWFDLSLSFTDDLDHVTDLLPYYSFAEHLPKGATVAALMLSVNAAPVATVGRNVLRMEKAAPGAGYAALGALTRALSRTVGCADPEWALNLMEMWGDDEDYGDGSGEVISDEGIDEEEDRITYDRFLARVPIEACHAMWNPDRAEQALRSEMPPKVRRTLEAAQALMELLPSGRLNDLPGFHGIDYIRPVVIRWSDKDHIQRLFDDYNEELQQAGEYSETCFFALALLDFADEEKARAEVADAVLRLRAMLTILAQADKLISLLHSRAPVRSNVPHRKKLVEIFNDEANNDEGGDYAADNARPFGPL